MSCSEHIRSKVIDEVVDNHIKKPKRDIYAVLREKNIEDRLDGAMLVSKAEFKSIELKNYDYLIGFKDENNLIIVYEPKEKKDEY